MQARDTSSAARQGTQRSLQRCKSSDRRSAQAGTPSGHSRNHAALALCHCRRCSCSRLFPSVRPKPTKTVLRSKQPVQKPDDYARDIYQAIKRAIGRPALQAYQHARRARARLPTNCYNGILNGLAQRADGDACASVFEDMRRFVRRTH